MANNGVELTEEELDIVLLQIKAVTKKLLDNGGVLSEEELKQIAGGGWLGATFLGYAFIPLGVTLGVMASLCVPVLAPVAGAIIGGGAVAAGYFLSSN